jgi:hypothetical protein
VIEQNDEKDLVAVPVAKGASLNDMLSKFSTAGRAGSAAAQAEKLNEASVIAVPLIAEAKSLQTRHGILNSKYLAKAEAVHASDWPSIFKSVPQGLEMDTTGQRMVPKNHDALRRLQQAAADAVSNLTSTFGDSSPGNDDLNSYSLANAAGTMQSVLQFSAHDPLYGTTSANYRRAVIQLRWWLDKSRAILVATEDSIERFLRYEAEAKELLANLTPQDGAPTAERAYIAKLPPTPTAGSGGSSFTDFDPREPAQQRQPEGVEVTPVGVGDGFRTQATKGRR